MPMRVLKYEYEAAAKAKAEAVANRAPRKPKPVFDKPRVMDHGGRRHYAPYESGYFGPDQPLSNKGQPWSKKHKVVLSDGTCRRDYKCIDTDEYGDMGVLRRYPEPKTRTFSHTNLVFPTDRSLAAGIRTGFNHTHVNDEWEKKILATQGHQSVQLTQREYFNETRRLTKPAG